MMLSQGSAICDFGLAQHQIGRKSDYRIVRMNSPTHRRVYDSHLLAMTHKSLRPSPHCKWRALCRGGKRGNYSHLSDSERYESFLGFVMVARGTKMHPKRRQYFHPVTNWNSTGSPTRQQQLRTQRRGPTKILMFSSRGCARVGPILILKEFKFSNVPRTRISQK